MDDGTIIQIDLNFHFDGPEVVAIVPPPHPVTISHVADGPWTGGSLVIRVTGPRGLVRKYMLYTYTPYVQDVDNLLEDYAVAV